MKKIVLFIASALIIACTESEESIWKKTISDYRQTIFDMKYDCKFKIHEIEKVKDILAKDSIPYYQEKFEINYNTELAYREELVSISLDSYKLLLENKDVFSKNEINEARDSYREDSTDLEKIKIKDFDNDSYLYKTYSTLNKYKAMPPDSVLYIVVRYVFSMEVPKNIPIIGGGKIENKEAKGILSSDGKKYYNDYEEAK